MSIMIRVSTEVLKAKAEKVAEEAGQVAARWDDLSTIIRNSRNYWEGNSGELHQQYLEANTEDVELILRRLKEHPKDLLQMAGIYEAAEADAQNQSAPLSSDVII